MTGLQGTAGEAGLVIASPGSGLRMVQITAAAAEPSVTGADVLAHSEPVEAVAVTATAETVAADAVYQALGASFVPEELTGNPRAALVAGADRVAGGYKPPGAWLAIGLATLARDNVTAARRLFGRVRHLAAPDSAEALLATLADALSVQTGCPGVQGRPPGDDDRDSFSRGQVGSDDTMPVIHDLVNDRFDVTPRP